MPDHLDGIAVFVAVAEAKGFRAAAERLGVSGSAVSQAPAGDGAARLEPDLQWS